MARRFVAKYGGKCSGCGEQIEAGDTLCWNADDEAVHDECEARGRREPWPHEVCDRCHLTRGRIEDGLCPDCRAE